MVLSDEEYKQRRDAALFKLELAAATLNRFITYSATQTVDTASGPIPSLRMVISQIRAEGTEVIDPALMALASIFNNTEVIDPNPPIQPDP